MIYPCTSQRKISLDNIFIVGTSGMRKKYKFIRIHAVEFGDNERDESNCRVLDIDASR